MICFGCIIESIQGTQKDIDKEKIQDSHLNGDNYGNEISLVITTKSYQIEIFVV